MYDRVINEEDSEAGFTLIELLVVMIIIGLLAAIAIPTFMNQRQGAWRSAMQSDLRNAAIAVESWAVAQQGTYTGLGGGTVFSDMFTPSDNVTMTVHTVTADGYCLQAAHSSISGETWKYARGTSSADLKPAAGSC